MAFRHFCPNAGQSGSLKCPGGDGKPGKGPKRCPGCGASPLVEEGRYGVFRYDPENRYPEEGAIFYQRPASAQLAADRLTKYGDHPRGYVVRFIRGRLLPIEPGR